MNDALALVLSKLGKVHGNGPGSYMALCPAHEDKNPSLGVAEGREQPVILTCYAGCERDAVLSAIGLDWTAVCTASAPRVVDDTWTPHGSAVAAYDYVDETGRLLFQVCRTADKQFPQRRPKPGGAGWIWKLGDTRRVLYRLPAVLHAVAEGRVIYVVEGEKDVHSIEAAGEVGTCNPGGAGKWKLEFSVSLADAHVVIVADRDTPGQNHARRVAESLADIAASVKVCEPSIGKDITDHLASGRTLAQLEVISSTGNPLVDLAPDIHEFLSTIETYDWLIPGLFERADRLILTGFEGHGKSFLLAQIAICCAAGLHPFSFADIEPCTVLYIDCENGRSQMRRRFRPLVEQAATSGHRIEPGRLRVIMRPEGLNLPDNDDAAWLLERVTAHRPDLLIIGPLYRLHRANPNDELPARATAAALDAARLAAGCAIAMEAHAGHGDTSTKTRSVRPTGTSLWMRWPEFGYGLQVIPGDVKKGGTDPKKHTPLQFKSWRGDRDERDWPDRIERGEVWPWSGVWDAGIPKRAEPQPVDEPFETF